MKRIGVLSIIGALAVLASAPIAAQDVSTIHGEISDSQCALNVHSLTKSHEEMLKSKSGAAGNTPATCSAYCVGYLGGNFVLTSKGHVYHLDEQSLARKFVGARVKLHGVVDTKNDVIHVLAIDAD